MVDALDAVATGSHAALNDVYQATRAKLFGICLKICGDRETASEALQDTYITVWRRADSFDPLRASPITWLATIARNKAIDRIRDRTRCPTVSDIDVGSVIDEDRGAEHKLLRADAERWVERHLAAVPSTDAALFAAIYKDQTTYADLASRLALPLGTVKSRVRRMIIAMRDELQKQEMRGEDALQQSQLK